MIDKVRDILQEQFSTSKWDIAHPKDGQQKECYIAQNEKQKVFIKFAVPIAALQRLGEIEVAPRVIASGFYDGGCPRDCCTHPCGRGQGDGKSYVIQEYISSTYPNWQWFADHLSLLAAFIKRYHNDQQLTSLLSRNASTNYDEHITLDIAALETQFRSLDANVLHTKAITSTFEKLKEQAKSLQPVQLVPIHPDPNTKNILLSANTMRMVDWDDVQLSDPMRDVGLLLWWYVPKQRWGEFFQAYGLPMDEAVVERIFWWAARTSLAVALWHVEHGYDCAAFLRDFVASVSREGNPRAVFG